MLEADSNRSWSVGQNVATIRRRRGLTLEGLSELSLVSRASISALENGADNPRVQTLWNLADALGVNFGTLIGDNEGERVLDGDGASVQLIDRQTTPKIVEAYLFELPAGIARNARSHVAGVQEHVVVLTGELLTGPSDGPSLLTPGQSVVRGGCAAYLFGRARQHARHRNCGVSTSGRRDTARPGAELAPEQGRLGGDRVADGPRHDRGAERAQGKYQDV